MSSALAAPLNPLVPARTPSMEMVAARAGAIAIEMHAERPAPAAARTARSTGTSPPPRR
jgi:hypothetical protein